MHDSAGMQELIRHFNENTLSHAFLLETNNSEKCLSNLLEFLSLINSTDDLEENAKLSQLISNESLPSLVVIRPDGMFIKKEQILSLKSFFKTKPTFSKFNMYIIMNAECLNSSSANTMLKFLEEPEDNILGFFITNNKENIIDTIKSRCQIVMDYYEGVRSFTIPKIWESIAINYVKEYESVHDEAILYNKNVILPLVHDKRECLFLFQSIYQVYEALLDAKINGSELLEIYSPLSFLLKYDSDYFLNQLTYLSSLLDDLNYNLNINLLVDRFILESR